MKTAYTAYTAAYTLRPHLPFTPELEIDIVRNDIDGFRVQFVEAVETKCRVRQRPDHAGTCPLRAEATWVSTLPSALLSVGSGATRVFTVFCHSTYALRST